MQIDWKNYSTTAHKYDELIGPSGKPRRLGRQICKYLNALEDNELLERQSALELAIKIMGITFTVYSEEGNIDRAWPLDLLPRIISALEWATTEKGLKQRALALNLFIHDLYNTQSVLKDGIIPAEIVATHLLKECIGIKPSREKWTHICGSDIVRDGDGKFYVLEDNLRIPSGVSYMLENRLVIKRVFPDLFENFYIHPVDEILHSSTQCWFHFRPGPAMIPR